MSAGDGDMGLEKLSADRKFRLILDTYKVKRIAVFGSQATGETADDSDLDFLVEFEKEADLLDQVGLKLEFEELFSKPVHVVTPGSLNKYIRDRVLAEAIYL